jgi:aryl-alcohol dehydrogenase-like predicted oxidoreductase
MKYRALGRTGYKVSTISFGAWAVGGSWGSVKDDESLAALHRAVDLGVNFFDTADVYGDGHSEKLLAQLKRERPNDEIIVATKVGRRSNPHVAPSYTRANITAYVERSLKNLEADALDIVQLHCPPTQVFYMPEVVDTLDELTKQGKIKHYGASVEKVEEAIKVTEYPNVKTVQIVFNIFRQRPAALFFKLARQRKVGVLARLPLSSGMLTGKITRDTSFSKDDHRQFNRHGEFFDAGETLSGFDFDAQLRAVDELRGIVPKRMSMAQFALRWILMHPAVTCAIPGAKRPQQVEENCAAADLPALSDAVMAKVQKLYERDVKRYVHHRW